MDSFSLIREPTHRKEQRFFFSFFSPSLTTSLFSFYQSRSAAKIGPSVLDSGDTEEMDVQPVKGKSFISVDPLGQVD